MTKEEIEDLWSISKDSRKKNRMRDTIEEINKGLKTPGLEVLEVLPEKSKGRRVKCRCGREFRTRLSHIKSGNTTSCGCRGKETRQYKKVDWQEVIANGETRIETCNGKCNPRRRIIYKGMKFTHAVAKWNAEFPNNPVREGEVVHHKDLDSLNDEIKNLQKMTRSEHATLHYSLRSGPIEHGGKKISFNVGAAIVMRLQGKIYREIGSILGANTHTIIGFFSFHCLMSRIKDGTVWQWYAEYLERKG